MFQYYFSISIFGERALMATSFVQYSLMISPENVSLDKSNLKDLISF